MKLRVRVDVFGTTLLAALGVAPLGCGGSAVRNGGSDGGSAGAQAPSGSGGSAATATGGGPAENAFPCLDPSPLIDESTGYVQCSNGYVHRTAQRECPTSLPRPDPVPNHDPAVDQCQYDSECTLLPHGFCGTAGISPSASRFCSYGCRDDSECGPGAICLCGDPVGQCVQARCTTDADCEPGFNCASYMVASGCFEQAFACQTPADTCGSDADCAVDTSCTAREGPSRQCLGMRCEIGRPFLVGGIERLPAKALRGDWLEPGVEPDVARLSPALRARVGREWLETARMEHASIAAFARFTMQLLAVGAPPELVTAATRAMADETAHAKHCFAIASRYLGRAHGPGALAIDGSLAETSLVEMVALAIREGCVGETIAALEAREAAEHADDPVIRAALLRISADETRHAELAWQFVQWALERGGVEIEALVRRELFAPVSELACASSPDDELLLGCGVLPPAHRRALRAQATARVIGPCARALLAANSAKVAGFAAEAAPELA